MVKCCYCEENFKRKKVIKHRYAKIYFCHECFFQLIEIIEGPLAENTDIMRDMTNPDEHYKLAIWVAEKLL